MEEKEIVHYRALLEEAHAIKKTLNMDELHEAMLLMLLVEIDSKKK